MSANVEKIGNALGLAGIIAAPLLFLFALIQGAKQEEEPGSVGRERR